MLARSVSALVLIASVMSTGLAPASAPVVSAAGPVAHLDTGPFVLRRTNASQAAAITLSKTVSNSPLGCGATNTITVFEGQQVTYCYTVRNSGDMTLTAHSLVDTQLGTILSSFAYTLTPGASTFVTRSATLTQTTTNSATWTASDGTVSATASSTATVTVTPAADLVISKIGSPERVSVGGVLSYTIVVTNTGPNTATTVIVTDALPSGLGAPAIATTQGSCGITNSVATCQLGTLGAGRTVNIALATTAPATRGTITNTAGVSSPNDPNTANNTASAVTAVLAPGLALTKTVGTNAATCATTSAIAVPTTTLMTYCYTVRNTGDYTFSTHTLSDTQLGVIVSGLTKTLAPGASTSITKSVLVSQTTANTTIWTASDGTYTATASSTATVGVGLVSDMQITKLVSSNPITINHDLTYTVLVTNAGPFTATNVLITDQLPAGVRLTGLGTRPMQTHEANGSVTFGISELPAGQSIPIVLQVKAPLATGVITNTATVTATNDYLPGNNTAQVTTTVTAYMVYLPIVAR